MSVFRFKQFAVEQHQTAMKVGTDGVLLGAWAGIGRAPQQILDIGAGTGVIALMSAQRFPLAKVLAIEVDALAAEEAAANFSASPWKDRLQCLCFDVRHFTATMAFDIIISNPPYFENGWPVEDVGRKLARDASALSLEELSGKVTELLSTDGAFYCILPPNEHAILCRYAQASGLWLHTYTEVITKSGKPVKRVLSEWRKTAKGAPVQSTLVLFDEKGEATEDYRKLTADFYLNH